MIKTKFNLRFAQLTMASALAFSSLGTQAAISKENWMKEVFTQVSADVQLNHIVIPGSHDSGTRGMTIIAEAQSKNMATHLNDGIRFFDVRARYGHPTLAPWGQDYLMYHGSETSHNKFFEEIDDFAEFAAAHPKEIIIIMLRLKDMSDSKIELVYDKIQDKMGAYMVPDHLHDATTTVQDIWDSNHNVIVMFSTADGTDHLLSVDDTNERNISPVSGNMKSKWANEADHNDVFSEVEEWLESSVSANDTKFSNPQLISTPAFGGGLSLERKSDWMSDDYEDVMTEWVYCDGYHLNLLFMDFYHKTNIVENAIDMNLDRYAGHTCYGTQESDDKFGYATATGDFNGDGYDDVAVGAPYEDIDGKDDAGAVTVIYGSSKGLSLSGSRRSQLWHQNTSGLSGISAEDDDRLGYSLAVGDFDGDGRDDLAIGSPGEDIGSGSGSDEGGVLVLYGSSSGLTALGYDFRHQDSTNVPGSPEDDDHFGYALAAGDFDGNGYDDLAVGVPKEDLAAGDNDDDGVVVTFAGSMTGLTSTVKEFSQQTSGVIGGSEADDHFGMALAAGDFDNDGKDDLAIGSPYEDLDDKSNTGTVTVIYGANGGLTGTGSQAFSQKQDGFSGISAEADDRHGRALTTGDFDGDGIDDLAIGAPGEDIGVGDNDDDGGVTIVFGNQNSGLSTSGYWFIHQHTENINGNSETDDELGFALAACDFDNDGEDDLAMGAPREDLNGNSNAGAVNVIYGSYWGFGFLSYNDDQIFYQGHNGLSGSAEVGDQFGRALAAGDFNNDGYCDLVVGSPQEDFDRLVHDDRDNAGMIHVIYGSANKLSISNNQQEWYQ